MHIPTSRPAARHILPIAILLATSGCAASLMHSDRIAARNQTREAAPTPAPVRQPVLSPVPVPVRETPPQPPAATPPPAPEAEPEPIVVSGSVPRKPRPPVPPVYPDTSATIVFTVRPAQNCATCLISKISVSPTGQVLIETGHWNALHRDWDYTHEKTRVKRNAVLAFAASLSAVRAAGQNSLRLAGPACAAASRDDGLTIEWLEFGRRDLLTVQFDCAGSGDRQLADRLRHAPNMLGLKKVAVP